MLQELLLALSGNPSPLFADPGRQSTFTQPQLDASIFTSAELSLLSSLATNLGVRHANVRRAANEILDGHESSLCRIVASRVVHVHLRAFQHKILDVERLVLSEDASIVAAKGTVPLSALAGAFDEDGWPRKLSWLGKLVSFVNPGGQGTVPRTQGARLAPRTAAEVINWLRSEMRTGFPDIALISRDLLAAAEQGWLRQLSAWILYAKHTG